MVKRVYVEKKPGFDVAAKGMLKDLQENFGIAGITGLRIAIRYDIDGLDEAQYEAACRLILAEPPVDKLYQEELPVAAKERLLAVEYLPGQYDQRADSAAQCIQLLTQEEKPQVRVATIYVFEGSFDEHSWQQIVSYCINPVDSREAAWEKPSTLDMQYKVPEDVAIISGFTHMDETSLAKLWKEMGLAMSVADLAFCQKYFKEEEKRDPTLTEIKVIDTYWSDHCRHTTFQTAIENIAVEGGFYGPVFHQAIEDYFAAREEVGRTEKPLTLMDMATINAKELALEGKLSDLDISEEINACSIKAQVDIDGKEVPYLVMFKNETHNHPTEIEPFGGAATCIGGAIRDPLSGRAYVYQAMRVTGCGDPLEKVEDTIAGKLPQRKITVGAAQGYSSYGNQIGLATGLVDEVYHPGYKAKRMEIGAVIAAAPEANVIREVPQPGDVVLLLGGATGRDGCGGATGSSKAHDENSILECGAEVQKGNPITERKLQRLYRNPAFTRLVKRCNDFGAGGVSVAIGELADGLDINLDAVPKKYEGLDGTELAISESQERMAVVVRASDVERVTALAAAENLDATQVAVITAQGRMTMKWRGKTIVDISREFLNTNGVRAKSEVEIQQPEGNYFQQQQEPDIAKAWQEKMASLALCCKQGLVERFDGSIGAGSVLMPFGGKHQYTPSQVMAAKVPLIEGTTHTGTWMSYGFDPYLSSWSPYHGGLYAVVDALTKIAAAGGDATKARLTMQEYFGALHDVPTRWGKPFAALLGAQTAMRALEVPAIGGKDSMSGSFNDIDVPPTLCAFAVTVGDIRRVISPEFKEPGHIVAVLNVQRDEHGLPDFEQLKSHFIFLAGQSNKIRAAAALGSGGIGEMLAKCAFGNGLGIQLQGQWTSEILFEPAYGNILVEVAKESDLAGTDYTVIGRLQEEPVISYESASIALADLLQAWRGTLEPVFPTQAPLPEAEKMPLYQQRNTKKPAARIAKPKVCIPVFPGTNCEYDLGKAFVKAGAEVEPIIFRNRTPQDIEESIAALAISLEQAQILAIPGGFSSGDEPDGSGKFIATTFRNPRLAEKINILLQQHDGLVIGICNGFQALIKLGLVPYGEIREMADDSPTLTFNNIGRHASRIVRTRVTSNLSPWFSQVDAGAVHHVAISHGEGRFVATEAEIKALFSAGQVATQYVDDWGNPTMEIAYNPNGSMFAIEGITSPDGRVLGKMGHTERVDRDLYVNVPGDYDQKIFTSGVAYFK